MSNYTANMSTSSSLIPTRRTSQPPSSGVPPHSSQTQSSQLGGMSEVDGSSNIGGANSDLDSVQNHAQNLRKVSEQLLSNPRTRQSFTGANVALPAGGTSRPGSIAR